MRAHLVRSIAKSSRARADAMRSLQRPYAHVRLWLFFGILLLAPASARGVTLYYALAGAGAGTGDSEVSGPSPTPVSADAFDNFSTPHGGADASASASGSLSLAGATSVSAGRSCIPPCYNPSADASVLAQFSGFDVILSGPSGESAMASLNLTFEGVAAASQGSAGAGVGTSLSGPGGTVTDAGGIGTSTGGSGLLSGWTGSGVLVVTTAPLLVGVSDVVTIDLSLSLGASCSTDDQVPVCHASSSVRSFSFAPTGPVFNLPDGWTANSIDGSIVNNTFIPEPSAGLLLVGGLLGLASGRKARA